MDPQHQVGADENIAGEANERQSRPPPFQNQRCFSTLPMKPPPDHPDTSMLQLVNDRFEVDTANHDSYHWAKVA